MSDDTFIRRWLRRIANEIRFWYQRRTRGWDDSELWSLDYSLAKLILPRLKAFRADLHGHPCCYDEDVNGEQAWNEELDKMIMAFEYIVADTDFCLPYGEGDAIVAEGLELFAKRFRGLWQ